MSTIVNGRYQLQDKLGEGGMGIVHRAHDRLTGDTVALKQVQMPAQHLQFMSRPSSVKLTHDLRLSLAREFQTLAGLRHPHIISVLDYGFVAGKDGETHPFYTMTYLPQANTMLEAGAGLSVSEKLGLVQQILQGLAYLHRRGILHRDLKPENVLVTAGHVHILDFGLSSRRDEDSSGSSGGSALYLSPELWAQQPASRASDLYALGVMAFELLAGQHPFAPQDHTLIVRVLYEEPDWQLLGVPEILVSVIAKLLVKDPEARAQQAQVVLADLNNALGIPSTAETAAMRESYLQAATFVGRETELTQLTTALTQTATGQNPVWLIGGESGVGKTRLTDEVRIQAMLQGLSVLHGQGAEGGGLPFQLWREPVRHLLLRQEVTALQAGILKDIAPNIGSLLGREIADAPKLDGRAYQQRLTLAIVDLFRELAEPVLLLLEDLQWAGESLAVLQQMLQIIEQLPGVMVLGNYRHDERPQLPEELPGAQTLILERLDEAEVAQLSQAMLGEAASSPHIVSLLTQETEGNTFFIVEVMRALAEEAGQLDSIGTMTLPKEVFTSGMQHLLQRRIQKVPAADQHLLQLAAVAGRQLDEQLLHNLAPGVILADWLQRAAEAMVLMVRDNQWQFSHDKLRETILFQLSDETRRSAHRHVAEAIEQLYPEDARNYPRLLGHWQAVGDEKKELTYLIPVATRLGQMSDFGQAHTLMSRGLMLLPPADGRRVVLLNEQARSFWRQGNFAEAEAAALLALNLAQEAGDDTGRATSLNSLGIIASKYGEYNTAQDYYQQSIAINQVIGRQQGIAANFLNMGVIMKLQGNYAAARDYYQQSLIIHRAVGDQGGIFVCLNNLGVVAEREGEYAAARDYQYQSLAIKRALGDQRGISNGFLNLGVIAESEGEYAIAHDFYQQSLAIKQAIGGQRGIAINFLRLGFIARRQGDYVAARDYHQQALAIARNLQAAPLLLEAIVGFAWLYMNESRPTRAGELIGLTQHHPAHTNDIQIRLDELLPELAEAMAPTELQAALARGKSLDLDTVVVELLAEFGETDG